MSTNFASEQIMAGGQSLYKNADEYRILPYL